MSTDQRHPLSTRCRPKGPHSQRETLGATEAHMLEREKSLLSACYKQYVLVLGIGNGQCSSGEKR